jgi:hypothetical protein
MTQSNKEANIILALQAYQNNPELGLHHTAEIYQASYLLGAHNLNPVPRPTWPW